MYKEQVRAYALFVIVFSLFLVAIAPQAKGAQFVLSGWTYPIDEYGQGLYLMQVFQVNKVGTYSEHLDSPFYSSESTTIEIAPASPPYNGSVKLRPTCYLNSTYLGLGSIAEGRAIIRHNITVNLLGTVVFSKENFTYYDSGSSGSIYWYQYEVVIDITPNYSQTYIAVFTFEIYMLGV